MTLRRLSYVLGLVFIFSVPWEQTLETTALGTLSKFVGILAAGGWLLAVLAGAPMRRLQAVHGAAFLFVAWSGLTIFWSLDPEASVSGFATNLQLLMLTLLVWDLLDSGERIRAGLQSYVLGSYVVIGGIIVAFLQGQTTVYERYAAPGSDVDNSALTIAIAIPAAFHLLFTTREGQRLALQRLVNFTFLPLAVFAMVLTGTRGALVALIPTFGIMLLVLFRAGNTGRLIAAVVVVASVGAVIRFAPADLITRVTSSTTEATGGKAGDTLTGRSQIWHESWDAFTRRPVQGVGNNAHRAAIPTGKVAHLTSLSILTETGLIGALVFLFVLFQLYRLIRRKLLEDDGFWFAQLSVIAIGSLSLTIEDRKSVWIMVSLAIGAASTVSARAPAPARSRQRPVLAAGRG